MIAPVEQLLNSMETLLTEGSDTYGLPGLFPSDGSIRVFRGDSLVATPVPHCALYQAGPAKERHKQGSGLWEIPMGAKLIMDRNGLDIGDSAADAAADIRTFSGDMEAILTADLLINSADPGDGQSTPEQRLTTSEIHVWEISDVEVVADTEAEGDPSCEVNFTAFCTYAERII